MTTGRPHWQPITSPRQQLTIIGEFKQSFSAWRHEQCPNGSRADVDSLTHRASASLARQQRWRRVRCPPSRIGPA